MRYCTKYVEIDAIKWDGSLFGNNGADAIERWSNGATHCSLDPTDLQAYIYVDTLEGKMKGNPGDYIVRGLRGEYYPCKPDVFEMKYEEVSDGTEPRSLPVGGEVPSTDG